MHILSTPNRKCVSDYLCDEAVQVIPGAIVLGIYGNEGNKYHLHFAEIECMEVSDIMGSGEFNVKLDRLMKYLVASDINIRRPFIVIGNYIPTGESLTFVNYSYGTVRGNVRLISTNAEENYQEACRSNYMTSKFIQENPEWVVPDKYLVGPSRFIDDALSYETENDARIDMFMSNPEYDSDTIHMDMAHLTISQPDAGGTVAIPVKIVVDRDTDTVRKMLEILQNHRRTEDQKRELLVLLKEGLETDACEIMDKSTKFIGQLDKFTLKDVRSYKQKEAGPKKGEWKFENYAKHHDTETEFINSKNHIRAFECEILTCVDHYILKNESGEVLEKNLRTVWWLGYKY
jgi:hypothetical protein